MKILATLKNFLLGLFLVVFCAACVNRQGQVEADIEKKEVASGAGETSSAIKNAPDWVNRGSCVVAGKEGRRLFHGVGFASPMGDMALQKSVADDRARDEIARGLMVLLKEVSSAYTATLRQEAGVMSEVQLNQSINAMMVDARIFRSWRDQKSNTVWSLAELDMQSVKREMLTISDLNADLKRYLDENIEVVFDRMLREKMGEYSTAR